MASNPLPENCGKVIILGDKMYPALLQYGTPLKIAQVPPPTFLAALTAFRGADLAYGTARTNRGAASIAWQATMAEVYKWLLDARKVLIPRLGERWSEAWVEAGFPNGTTAIPQTTAGRITVLAKLVNFFTLHPTYQVAGINVTAVKASDLHYAATAAGLSWTGTDTAAQNALTARGTTCAALKKLMRDIIKGLGMALGPLDTRWEDFGLNMPGANTTPGQPDGVQAFENPQGGINVLCLPVPLATRYRWRMKVVGVDEKFRLAVSSPMPDAIITEVRPGNVVDLYVQAVNGSSQGVASATVRVTVSLTGVQPSAPAPASHAGNGNGNGNGNGIGGHTLREGDVIFAATR